MSASSKAGDDPIQVVGVGDLDVLGIAGNGFDRHVGEMADDISCVVTLETLPVGL